MSIEIQCECGKRYRVGDELAGRVVGCKACSRKIRIPAPAAEDDPFADPVAYETAGRDPDPAPPMRADALDALVTNTNTVASNAGRTRVDFVKYITCYPAFFIVCGVLFVGGAVGAFIRWEGVILCIIPPLFCARKLVRVRAKFRTGDINPAVVISQRPWLAAVYTDLRTGPAGARPAIKIIEAPLGRITGGPPAVGTRLVAASLYFGRMGSDAWLGFNPTIVQSAVTNAADIQRLMRSIRNSEWNALDRHLANLPKKSVGLHKIWLGTSSISIGGAIRQFIEFTLLGVLSLIVIAVMYHQTHRPGYKYKPPAAAPGFQPPPLLVPSHTAPPPGNHPRIPPIDSPSRSGVFKPPTSPTPDPTARPATRPSTRPAVRPSPAPSAVPPPSAVSYEPNQPVEILWGATWYKGKILRQDGDKYLVHYDGWSDSFNEKVGLEKLRPPVR